MIYFIRAVYSGAIKIGLSNDPRRRLEAMQTGSPEPLELLGMLPGDAAEERWLHDRFKEYRIHGEWFKGDEEFAARINRLIWGDDEPPLAARLAVGSPVKHPQHGVGQIYSFLGRNSKSWAWVAFWTVGSLKSELVHVDSLTFTQTSELVDAKRSMVQA